MFRRSFLLLAILAAATVGPYAMFSDNLGGNLKKKWTAWTSGKKKTATVNQEFDLSPTGLPKTRSAKALPIAVASAMPRPL